MKMCTMVQSLLWTSCGKGAGGEEFLAAFIHSTNTAQLKSGFEPELSFISRQAVIVS